MPTKSYGTMTLSLTLTTGESRTNTAGLVSHGQKLSIIVLLQQQQLRIPTTISCWQIVIMTMFLSNQFPLVY